MERIYIKNFAGIELLDIELNNFNIFIGKQASGKSITAKLVYYFKSIIREFLDTSDEDRTKSQLIKKISSKFTEYFPSETWPAKNFEIIYFVNKECISVFGDKGKIKIDFSLGINKLYLASKKLIKNDKLKFSPEGQFDIYRPSYNIYKRYYDIVSKEFGNNSCYNPIFIPAGRSFFANLQSSIFSFLSNNKSIDPFLVEFGSFYENMKSIASRNRPGIKNDSDIENLVDELIIEILGGRYLREKDEDYLVHKDKRKINVSFSSSGQQETLPLLLILKAILKISFIGNGYSIFIEEPEAHLFPSAQKSIIEFFALAFNNNRLNESQFTITTHSPYILTSINNLLQAKITYDSVNNKNDVTKVIPEAMFLSSRDIAAYSFVDGHVESIIDAETGLIYSSYLDSVSNDIAIEFDKLLNID